MVIGLLGIDFSSYNRGCGALGYAALEIFNSICEKKGEKLEVHVFLYRLNPMPKIQNDNIIMHYIVIEPKRLAFWKKAYKSFKSCECVWDFTGGDSFSDIYGMKRFCLNSALKQVAIWSRTKFVIGPQTIGPFTNKFALLWAKHILKKAKTCFVRDSISEEYVKETFKITPLLTTDVAFSLPYKAELRNKQEKICIGFNPSGLLWEDTKGFCASKHIKLNYKEYVKGVLEFLCKNDCYKVYLIPHVFSKDMEIKEENDLRVCCEMKENYPQVEILCDFETPMEAKGVISSMDVFIGARMHATIAAFSSGVPTIPVSYSRKFEGLYSDLKYPYLIGATSMNTEDAIQKTVEWIQNTELLASKVKEAGPLIKEKQQVLVDLIEKDFEK